MTLHVHPMLCRQATEMRQMSVQELSTLLNDPAARADTQFIDVREQEEHRLAALPLFELQPLSRWAPAEHPCKAEVLGTAKLSKVLSQRRHLPSIIACQPPARRSQQSAPCLRCLAKSSCSL